MSDQPPIDESAEHPSKGPNQAQPPASPGDTSASVTPKDVPRDCARAHEVAIRPTASPDPEIREEALLDEGIDLTFPASDPVAIPTPQEVQRHSEGHHQPTSATATTSADEARLKKKSRSSAAGNKHS